MNHQELERRNKILERRWKIVLIIAVLFVISRPIALKIVNNKIDQAKDNAVKNDYPLIDPARQFIPQDEYITNVQSLRVYLQGLEKQYPDRISVYYEQFNSGANIVVNRDLRLFPASLSKLALALIVANKVESGILKWDTELSHTDADLSSGSGELYKTIGNKPTSVEKLVTELLTNSDNTAQNILRRNVTIEDYVSLQTETGLEDLYDMRGYVSAKEYSRILRLLYTSSFLERENSQKLLEMLANAKFKNYLSQSIPDNIKFAHKYGENTAEFIFADSGIVYVPGRPYMITVILKGEDASQKSYDWAVALMKEISEKAYEIGKK
jgi:beta-lactamase class A